MRFFFVLSLVIVAASAVQLVPLYTTVDSIPNRYILQVKDDVELDSVSPMFAGMGIGIKYRYEALKGFAVEAQIGAIEKLRHMTNVFEYIEADQIATPLEEWNLDRIDQRGDVLDDIADFYGTGAGVHVYIVDTGLRHSHLDFGRRASYFYDYEPANQGEDCNGHGTHVGGVAVAGTVGIAVEANVYSVRVLSCTGGGSITDIIAGCDAITVGGALPGAVNVAIGSAASTSYDNAILRMHNAGFVVTVAAGNKQPDGFDACTVSPGRVPEAITVSATLQVDDCRPPGAAYGSCVDVFAPGEDIRSTTSECDSCYGLASGTSMSSAHVSGVVAIHLAAGTCSDGDSCSTYITNDATANVICDVGTDSPNLLLYCD